MERDLYTQLLVWKEFDVFIVLNTDKDSRVAQYFKGMARVC